MQISYFASTLEFRQWLEVNYLRSKEIIVGYYKVKTGKPSMTWSDSVDVALCFGWIDGIRRSIDEESYCIRFTPRHPKSIWSKINIDKVERLIKEGLMTETGLMLYQQRNKEKSGIYSFETSVYELSMELENLLRQYPVAFGLFDKLPPSYKRTHIHWVMSAKQEKTRITRLMKMIDTLEKGKKLF